MRGGILSSASAGGAGIAAQRLYEALSDSRASPYSWDFITVDSMGGQVPREVVPRGTMSNNVFSNTAFTGDWGTSPRAHVVSHLSKYDILNVHWSSDLISLSEISALAQIGMPIVFTLHDFYYATGGCHYPASCQQYKKTCEICPQVNQVKWPYERVLYAQKLKRQIFACPNVELVAPSEYLRNLASTALAVGRDRSHVVRNVYEPVLPQKLTGSRTESNGSPVTLLLIADSFVEVRKNLATAIEVLGKINLPKSQSLLVKIVGNVGAENKKIQTAPRVTCEWVGQTRDHSELGRIFQESDFIFSPSLEDNWPNVLVEAASYGVVPIVGPGHGCEEFVKFFGRGIVSDDYSSAAMCQAVEKACGRSWEVKEASQNVRLAHAPSVVSAEYCGIFDRLIGASPPRTNFATFR